MEFLFVIICIFGGLLGMLFPVIKFSVFVRFLRLTHTRPFALVVVCHSNVALTTSDEVFQGLQTKAGILAKIIGTVSPLHMPPRARQ